MLIYLDIKIPHLKIAHLGGNLEVGNIDIQGYQDCPPQLFVVFVFIIDLGSVLTYLIFVTNATNIFV